jgi:methionyl-tRNA formyltransferase
LGIVCGSGILGIRSLQLAGKRAMSAAEFLNGKPDFIGARLG